MLDQLHLQNAIGPQVRPEDCLAGGSKPVDFGVLGSLLKQWVASADE